METNSTKLDIFRSEFCFDVNLEDFKKEFGFFIDKEKENPSIFKVCIEIENQIEDCLLIYGGRSIFGDEGFGVWNYPGEL